MNTHIEMFGIPTKINMHNLRNRGAGARGRKVGSAWLAVLPSPVWAGSSPQSVSLYLLAHKPLLQDTVTVLQTAAVMIPVSQYISKVESPHLGHERLLGRARDMCGSAPSPEPKTCLLPDELPGSEHNKEPSPSHLPPPPVQSP